MQAGLWIGFALIVVIVLALDLGLFNRKAHTPRLREAALWSLAWVLLAVGFGAWVFVSRGAKTGTEFATGYLIELSLSVDNVFLFAVLFRHFGVRSHLQHRVLFWGIIGAVVLRGVMVAAGSALLARFEWITYLFGAFLIVTGIRMFLHRNRETDVSEMAVTRWCRRLLPLSPDFDGQRFITRVDGSLLATPLLLVLVMVEFTDVVFALDSIPAVFAVSRDPFVVFTSNIMAILGLRSFYFLLAGVMGLFEYLSLGLSTVLVFVGVKMLGVVHVDTGESMAIIGGLLGVSIAMSLAKVKRKDWSDKREARKAAMASRSAGDRES